MDRTRTFTIESCLGRGGFGEVYRARVKRAGGMERVVALKVLRNDIDPDGQAVRRLRDEGRLLATVSHPSILKVHDLILLEGRIALMTEFVDGQDLTACMEGPGALSLRGLVGVLAAVTSAVEAAWSTCPRPGAPPLRMVHRDLKPSNIRISQHGGVKLLDFGIARTDSLERESRTRTGMMVGSPAYMAPERFLEKDVLVESDVFSIGAILFEGMTGERFYGTLPLPMQVGLAVSKERYDNHLKDQLAKLDHPGILSVLERVLRRDPTERLSPSALLEALNHLADGAQGLSLDRWCRRRVWPASSETSGELEGRVITEGLLVPPVGGSLSASLVSASARPAGSSSRLPPLTLGDSLERMGPTAEVPPPAPDRVPTLDGLDVPPPLGWELMVGTLVGALLILVGSLAAGSTIGSMAWYSLTDRAVAPEIVAPSGDGLLLEEVDMSPTLAPPVGEKEVVAPEQGGSHPAHSPSSTTVAPAPIVEEPKNPLGGEPPVYVRLKGTDVAYAVSSVGRVRLPAHLAPGHYRIEASFNGVNTTEAGTIDVRKGIPSTVACSVRMERCSQR